MRQIHSHLALSPGERRIQACITAPPPRDPPVVLGLSKEELAKKQFAQRHPLGRILIKHLTSNGRRLANAAV